MYKELIKNWIPNLTPIMIKDYARKIGTNLTDSEVTILYNFIKKNYIEILDGNETSLIFLKQQLNPTLYKKVIALYQENKRKYL